MPLATTLLAFTLMNMSFALIPGPDVMCILGNALARGARAGMAVCLGIAAACLVHVACATLGLSAVLMAAPHAFWFIKLAGALYLGWVGWGMLRHAGGALTFAPRTGHPPFVQGAISNLLNPKIMVFFVAILPQFIDPALGHAHRQALVLGLLSVSSGTAVNLVTACVGARLGIRLHGHPTLFRRITQLAGLLLLGLALRVLWA